MWRPWWESGRKRPPKYPTPDLHSCSFSTYRRPSPGQEPDLLLPPSQYVGNEICWHRNIPPSRTLLTACMLPPWSGSILTHLHQQSPSTLAPPQTVLPAAATRVHLRTPGSGPTLPCPQPWTATRNDLPFPALLSCFSPPCSLRSSHAAPSLVFSPKSQAQSCPRTLAHAGSLCLECYSPRFSHSFFSCLHITSSGERFLIVGLRQHPIHFPSPFSLLLLLLFPSQHWSPLKRGCLHRLGSWAQLCLDQPCLPSTPHRAQNTVSVQYMLFRSLTGDR